MKKQTIYICTEIKNREYVSNIFLAMHSALRGYRVYLGTHAAIYALMRKKIKKDGIICGDDLEIEYKNIDKKFTCKHTFRLTP